MKGYRVERTEHGVAVYGPVPLDDFSALQKVWSKEGFDTLALGVASALGATFAVTTPAGAEAWKHAVEQAATKKAAGDPELEWLLGPDTGFSSLTIFYVLTSEHTIAASARLGLHGRGSYPHDPDDFGRCYRLLKAIPEWRARLGEVADVYDVVWPELVDAWDELEALYEQEAPSGRAPKLYQRMKQLIGRRV
jgi:hypothetical protein